MNFKNKTVVITGGTRGIGKKLVELFSSAGANIIYTGRSSFKPPVLDTLAFKNATYVSLDFEDKNSISSFCSYLGSLHSIDVLINNAGINRINRVEDIKIHDFEAVMNVNVQGPFIISKKACQLMKKNGGHIVNIASIWSTISKEGRASYATSKAALVGLTRSLAVDFAAEGILVNAVSPGFTITDLTLESLDKEEISHIESIIPCKRMAKTSEIGELVLFLASSKNTYITGQNFVIDGGFSIV